MGARIAPLVGDSGLPRFRIPNVEPRGRLMVGIRGAKLFATAERFRYFPAFNLFVVVNAHDQDAFTLRLTE